ncbi:holo-ACP synthase [Paeniglutamicibacter sp. ZC-3]|uniref:holo-ACP synthase n=1 Tax=Paeniglutamicibacter sp. ZC-3 TaxID=2986919 RepID=UPI0021F6A4FF|nr:holo-ACP synthase [Paeniglutamicibacter sp. ZC-3]MCV9996608.1 holo-ACP synthase [Paeniglutamicibacter sp. ZC-3]
MIIGIGVDVVQISRFDRQLIRTPSLLDHLFSPEEQVSHALPLAAHFAAKEAIVKAVGAPAGLDWLDCQVLVEVGGLPRVSIMGSIAAVAAIKGINSWHLSMSQEGDLAIAMVIAEK